MYRHITLFTFLFSSFFSYSQTTQITPSKLQFDGKQLIISFDILNARQTDRFFVWVVIQKEDGEEIMTKTISGDIGDIFAGKNKTIYWSPSNDSIFLNESVTCEIKAEKYIKSFNKSSMILLSFIMPGWGKTKISQGKPYWLIGVASYGALAGSLVTYGNYNKNYDRYVIEEDQEQRNIYLDNAEKQANLSNSLLVTAAVIIAANVCWTALTPDRYKPLKSRTLTIGPSADPLNRAAMISMQYKF